jgi:C4-dicarboxylate transporter, DctQ subunit
MKKLVVVLEAFGRTLGWISVGIVSLLAFPMVYDVVMRTAGHPTIWAYELTIYALVAATFFANADALREGRHFRVTALLRGAPGRVLFLNRLANAMTLGFGLILFTGGSEFAYAAFAHKQHAATLLFVPLYYPRLAIPVGALGLAAQALANLVKDEYEVLIALPTVQGAR